MGCPDLKCTGEWTGGSGGHRVHKPCGADADWWHPDDPYAYCEKHIEEHDRADYWPVHVNGAVLR